MPLTTFLLAGQGAYSPGILTDPHDPAIAEVLDVTDKVAAEFGRTGVRAALTDAAGPSANDLARTDPFALQLAVFAAAIGEYRLAARHREPDVLLGHSMGEIAALTVAGAFDLPDGVRLICHRAEALIRHCPEPGGMLAVELPAGRTEHLARAIGDRRLAVAVLNAPAQTVVAGPNTALQVVQRAAQALDVRTARLNAPYPFHSPGLALAAEQFAESAAGIRQRPLRRAVYSPSFGDYVADTTDLLALLAAQLTTPVRFMAALRELHAAGVSHYIECGRAGLHKLVRACVPDVDAHQAGGLPTPGPVEPTGERASEPSVPVPPLPGRSAPDPETVIGQLRDLYATTLGYPTEAVTPDADLEADLGVDSLKRAEMLGKVGVQFGLAESANDDRFAEYSTLAELAEMVVSAVTTDGRHQ